MNALAELNQSYKAIHPLDLLFVRAAALADRVRDGSLPFIDAVDMAYKRCQLVRPG